MMEPHNVGNILINGDWEERNTVVPVQNPARIAETVGYVAICSQSDAEDAIAAAHHAYAIWRDTTPEERARRLLAAAQALHRASPELAKLFVRENGKPLREAERDIARSIELLELIANDLPKWWRSEVLDPLQPVHARRRPRGVTSVISPWNSPVLLSFKRFAPAIATGNTVVLKPATHCPLTLIECLRIMSPHFPPGVLNLVTGPGRPVGEILAADKRVRSVAFTGSTATGRRIMELASATVKNVLLELGGNDPALVLHDAILDPGAIGRMTNAVLRAAGQVCVAVKRIYVHQSRYAELVEKLSASFDGAKVGDGLVPDTTMGPLNNQAQFDFVTGLIQRCRQDGLTVITKGRKLMPESWDQGYFMLPALILGAEDRQEIVQCEQFGPVVPVVPFTDEDEAIGRANDSEFGLRASVWSSDRDRAIAIADRLEAGAVFYNSHGIFRDLHIEFPGIKQSGLGHESRWAALDHYADTYGFSE